MEFCILILASTGGKESNRCYIKYMTVNRLKQWVVRKGRFLRHDSASRHKPLDGVSSLAHDVAYGNMSLSHDGIHSKARIAGL
jgi:hypothetical protein